ncbi:hypothetical protein [Neolewinella persica]|uniref:hypothetical protein n=1 Tax=Neolewinella persica TaxID=70998 RepID=UPI00037C458A|nr:hypothetical protein [Neolewinella persica]
MNQDTAARHTCLPAAFFSDEKKQKSLAVLVPDRLPKAQKPKRKKLALVPAALYQCFPITCVENKKLSSSTLKQFFFFNGFCAFGNRHQQGRPSEVEAWGSIQRHLADRQSISFGEIRNLCFRPGKQDIDYCTKFYLAH